mmetsp:Transcript_13661/g.15321  ORF Transcript_13661/g.15321 Transcript_13661/m.15321 type:complete len:115 (-) Transcript_13661:1185-1529(-)
MFVIYLDRCIHSSASFSFDTLLFLLPSTKKIQEKTSTILLRKNTQFIHSSEPFVSLTFDAIQFNSIRSSSSISLLLFTASDGTLGWERIFFALTDDQFPRQPPTFPIRTMKTYR